MVNFVLQIRVFKRGDGSIVPVPHVGHGVRAPTESNVGGWGGWQFTFSSLVGRIYIYIYIYNSDWLYIYIYIYIYIYLYGVLSAICSREILNT